MAKISVEFDTKEKSLAVSLDGKKLSNVSSVWFSQYGDEASVEVSQLELNEDEKMAKVVRTVAKTGDDGLSEGDDGNRRIQQLAEVFGLKS